MTCMRNRLVRTLMCGAGLAALSACAVGPNYVRPKLDTAPAYKEAQPAKAQGWSPARPADLSQRGDWWTLFNDPALNALEAQRARGISATEAVREACLLRFRPILMTTLAAGLGALPLAIGFGEGSELRQPLGVAIIGGLIASQLLTLLTTPVVYIYLDRLRPRGRDERFLSRIPGPGPAPAPAE